MGDLDFAPPERARRQAGDEPARATNLASTGATPGKSTLTESWGRGPGADDLAAPSLSFDVATAGAHRQLDAPRAAHAVADHYASCAAADQLKQALECAARAARTEQADLLAELQALAAPLLAAAFRPSPEAVAETLIGKGGRALWDRDVATWRAQHGASVPAPGRRPAQMVSSAPIQLDPSAPPRAPHALLGLAREADLKAEADRETAERLLESTALGASGDAEEALAILLAIPADRQGKAIDGLGEAAFANLLDRIPAKRREQFSTLLDGVHNPTRKLQLWGAVHKSRATNDLDRYRGDVGKDVPLRATMNEDGDVVQAEDPEEKAVVEATWTPAQKANRSRAERREATAESTAAEVDRETARLMKKSAAGTLNLADVDATRERKELEYQLELESNVNLTAQRSPGFRGDDVAWSMAELEQVRLTLARLPQAHDVGAFREIRRESTAHMLSQRAESASTPEQVVGLEHEVAP